MTLSEERAGSSRRADGQDETETGPHTAALPSFDTTAFGATRLDTAAFPRTDAVAATSWFGAATVGDDEMPEDPEISELTEYTGFTGFGGPAPDDRTAVFATGDPDVTDGVDGVDGVDGSEVTSTMAPFDAAEVTSTMAPIDLAEITSTMPPVGWSAPTETTGVIPPADAAEVTSAMPPVPASPASPVEPAEATEVVAPTPMMVVGSRGVRRASPSAAGPGAAPAPTSPPAPPKRTGLLGLFSGPQGVVMRLLLVMVLLAGVVGTVVVTDPHVLTGFKTSPDAADGPLTTLAPAAPDVVGGGLVPPGGLMPGMLPMPPMGAPLGAPPPLLAPGPLGRPPGAVLPPGPVPPPVVPRVGGIGVGDVLGALFDSGKGDFASHFDNSGNAGLIEDGYYPSVVPNPQFPGRQAFQMALAPGGKRSEVLPVGPGTQPVDGEQQFVRYSAILGPNFPVYTDGFQLIMQWHHQSNEGSPPLALQVNRGTLNMVSGGDNVAVIGPVAPGQPINLTMQIRFSSNPGLGAVSVWRDGRPVIVDWHPVRGTMFTPAAYLKMGMYRSQGIMQGGAVTITDLKIGQTPNAIGGLGPLAPR